MRIEWIREQFKDILSAIDYLDGPSDIKDEAKLRTVNLCDMFVNELIVPENGRMTNAQRDRLWEMCGNYNVKFREDDYYNSGIVVEGWVGGFYHGTGNSSSNDGKPENKRTIYVGVEPNGDSHT